MKRIMKPSIEYWQLANYLAYELEVKACDTVTPGVLTSIVSGMAGLILYEQDEHIEYYELYDIKPMLRPMSQLVSLNPQTKKPFYFDVLSAACPVPFLGRNNKFWKHKLNGQNIEVKNDYNDYSFDIELDNGDVTVYNDGELTTTDNQANCIQQLYKYHFDVHRLIEEEVAIEKYILDKK